MFTDHLQKAFKDIGVKFHKKVNSPIRRFSGQNLPDDSIRLDTSGDKRSPFVLRLGKDADGEIKLLNVDTSQHGVLLQIQQENVKVNFLCGLDEFDKTFIARVPNQGITTVANAKDALKPPEVLDAERSTPRMGKKKNKHKRRNSAWLRQGEWFFIPMPKYEPGDSAILRKNAPLMVAGNRAHKAELVADTAGESRYISIMDARRSLSKKGYERLMKENSKEQYKWEMRSESSSIYVKGRITAPDHKTLVLNIWHRAVPNRELSRTSGRIATTFYD